MDLAKMLSQTERFNIDLIGIEPPNRPTLLGERRMDFRLGHIREEMAEIRDGYIDENIFDVTDGLLDLIYVALGTLIEMGIAPGPVFNEVHRANMERVRGESSRSNADGFDAVKPEGWEPPNLKRFLSAPQFLLAPKPKILVMGYARHGKDTVAEMMSQSYDLKFTSSSWFCAEKIILPKLHHFYNTVEECFEDRSNKRAEWFNIIDAYNRPDPSALGRAIFAEHDIYCGIRSKREFHALRNSGVFDVSVWVDRSNHLPPEGKDSCTVEPWMAEFVIDNNGTLEDLEFNVQQFMENVL